MQAKLSQNFLNQFTASDVYIHETISHITNQISNDEFLKDFPKYYKQFLGPSIITQAFDIFKFLKHSKHSFSVTTSLQLLSALLVSAGIGAYNFYH